MLRSIASLLVAFSVAGCTHLLPREAVTHVSGFQDFEDARRALERTIPFSTTVDDLRTLGFDVQASVNVSVIPYPELVTRLAPNPSVPLSALDDGIRECILSRMDCRAYEFKFSREHRNREGGFWADFLNFRRTTVVSRWHFNALVVVRDGIVLFRNHGGQPRIARTERRVNPLGPFQPAGEASGGLLVR